MALLAQFLLLLLSVCFISVHSYEYVPVYMWETSKNYSPLPALGRINEEFFRDILLDKLNKDKSVVVFLEKNLSPEDFTTVNALGKNLFNSLSHIKNDAQVNYYPFVEAPLRAVENLPGVKVSKVKVTEDGLPAGTTVEPGQVLVVNLDDAKENEDRNQMLSRHDTLMASIYNSVIAKNKNIISLYTAVHSSWLVPSELEENSVGRRARHLLATEEEKAKDDILLINTTNTLIYASKPSFLFLAGDKKYNISACSLSDSTENVTSLSCKANDTKSANLNFEFESSLGYWYLKKIGVSISDEKIDVSLKGRELYAPYKFSYHCNNVALTFSDTKDEDKFYKLTIPGFQVERFYNKTGSRFSDAYDCIGFMTAPIGSGLFVTFILAIIMTVGLTMIMDIKTMDRFDDPKGKTISISVVE